MIFQCSRNIVFSVTNVFASKSRERFESFAHYH